MRSATRPIGVVSFLILTTGIVAAQPQPGVGPVRSPSFSPYLNLLGRNNNPTVNYFGIIRPGQQLAQQQNVLQQQLAQTSQAANSNTGGTGDALVTGRGATFGYYSHYFYGGTSGGGGLGGGGFGASGGISRPSGGGFAGGGGALTAFTRSNVNIGQAVQGGARPPARRGR